MADEASETAKNTEFEFQRYQTDSDTFKSPGYSRLLLLLIILNTLVLKVNGNQDE